MKEKETRTAENKEKDKSCERYTIIDRYLAFCNQAHLDSGRIEWNDRYLNRWFSY